MGNKMMYVRKDDETFWSRGEALAAFRGRSFSEYVGDLIRKDVMADELRRRQRPDALALMAEIEALQAQLRARLEEESP